MKKTPIIIAIALIIILGFFVYYQKSNKAPVDNSSQVVKGESVIGTYVGNLAKDVYTLTISSEQGELIQGKLDINNFEKDSSSGTLSGTYKDGILRADYKFMSEGMESLGWVVFKKVEGGFVRGYGDVGPETKVSLIDLSKITFDMSVVYKLSAPNNTIANPASVNCEKVGGTLKIQKRGDGAEYGLCYFEDNRACEEWALLRGDCPFGGMRTTGYDTIDQNYCAWLGGSTMAVTGSICTLKNGTKCPTIDLYNGTCPKSK